jgi:N-methylhydantoinase A
VIADIRHDRVLTVNMSLDRLDEVLLNRHLATEGREARALVVQSGISVSRIDTVFELDMHYLGQTHTVRVKLPEEFEGEARPINQGNLRMAFERTYRAEFSRLLPDIPVRIVSLRSAAIGRRPHFDLSALAPQGAGRTTPTGSRRVRFGGAWHDTAIWPRLDLGIGTTIEGPAILEQPDATTVIDPGLFATVDELGNLILRRGFA